MSSLRDIRRQLRSVENIKKITDTMERVAAARLRHAQTQAEQSRPYITRLKEILEHVSASEVTHPLFEKKEPKKMGVVIIAADRGLSGSYNTTVFQTSDKFLKQYDKSQIELILLGRKSIDYYKQRKWKIRSKVLQWEDSRAFDHILKFSQDLVQWFLSGELDEVWLIYTHYLSIMRRNVVTEKFLNIEKPTISLTQDNLNYIFEPNIQEILNEILPRYCTTRIQTALFESYASELAARIIAMQTASKNSEEMINRLTLTKNKIRQADITKEMIEITSGS